MQMLSTHKPKLKIEGEISKNTRYNNFVLTFILLVGTYILNFKVSNY